MNARFYQALFGMQTGKKNRCPPSRAISLGDGYVGMSIFRDATDAPAGSTISHRGR